MSLNECYMQRGLAIYRIPINLCGLYGAVTCKQLMIEHDIGDCKVKPGLGQIKMIRSRDVWMYGCMDGSYCNL